jgi:rhodanese-related sulfurtransferase
MLLDGDELALLDVREELTFSQNHLLHARSIPLSRLEIKMASLVPRRSTRIVLCDANDGLAERAAVILSSQGYLDVSILQGGAPGWAEAGFELFSGVNVPSKAFGEYVEQHCGTPSIDAADLNLLLEQKADVVVVDSRPFDEFARVSIPTATNIPGAELVLRIKDIAPSPDTLIVVNCAGRTRSIIGAQSLINAGLPNRVVALRNGTMGWALSGLKCDSGADRSSSRPSSDCVEWARKAAAYVAQRYGVRKIDLAILERMQAEAGERTLYLFDVRSPEEYERGHIHAAVSAPGGQLVQATDQYVGTFGARIVLIDDAEVRAVMTASWLIQMGWKEVFVLVAAGTETSYPPVRVLGKHEWPDAQIGPAELQSLLAKGVATVVDLSVSRTYRASHIPGAWFAIRSRLRTSLPKVTCMGQKLVLTSEDGITAGLAVPEARSSTNLHVLYLVGGNAAWKSASYALEAGEGKFADEPVDVWLKPYERRTEISSAMSEYLLWEIDMFNRVERDGSCNFNTMNA